MYVQVRMAIRNLLLSEKDGGEGEVRSMYLDHLGYVTTGRGNKLSTPASASVINGVRLSWERIADRVVVDPTEVTKEYNRVGSDDTKKLIPSYTVIGGSQFIDIAKGLGIVTLRLTADSLDKLFKKALEGFEDKIKQNPDFRDFDKIPGGFPADAELGILSVAWAAGAGALEAPWLANFSRSCKERRWGDIASLGQYKWKDMRAGRDKSLKTLFENAQAVEDRRKTMPGTDVTIISPPYDQMTLNPETGWMFAIR